MWFLGFQEAYSNSGCDLLFGESFFHVINWEQTALFDEVSFTVYIGLNTNKRVGERPHANRSLWSKSSQSQCSVGETSIQSTIYNYAYIKEDIIQSVYSLCDSCSQSPKKMSEINSSRVHLRSTSDRVNIWTKLCYSWSYSYQLPKVEN